MDKFGIFKLLNSFYDFYSKSKGDNSLSPPIEKAEKMENMGGFSSKDNTLPIPPQKVAPLQNSMLSTMKNHDEILRRVKNLSPKT